MSDANPPAPAPARLESVDLLRGIIMALMALDHTRGWFSEATFYPLDLDKTNVPLFLTRWVTHLCAPGFIFLAGAGAFLSTLRGMDRRGLSVFLITRGLWIALLEVTWVRCLGWTFNFDYHFVGLSVLWAIAWSLVVLGVLVWLPVRWIAVFAVGMIATHNLFDHVKPADWGALGWLWKVLHSPGGITPAPGFHIAVGYVLVPWMGVMALGFAVGALWQRPADERRKWLFCIGAGMTVVFFALRFTNGYGDTHAWSPQKNAVFTFFSMIHCEKYPPSLLFLLMTLGPLLMSLAWLERGTPRLLSPLIVFGRVPLFYYLLHLPLLHGAAVLVAQVRFGRSDWLTTNQMPGVPPTPVPPENGFGLPGVYLVWVAALLVLWPCCKWFADLKQRRRGKWLSYL
ncbi:MAG: DUF1624 domain-containing protein [Verrucomicrobia bacterium]|nr:DUF1624 domain-containing protein [Verrucomicrobiota bacterium]